MATMRPGRRVLPLAVLLGVLAATAAVAFAGTVSWGKAIEVPGTAALNVGGHAGLWSVSCPSAGNCVAGGYYSNGSNSVQALVVSEKGGVWGTATEVPGTAALNVGQNEEVASVSCAAPGDCIAGGGSVDSVHTVSPAFVVDETNGSWGIAHAVRGLAHLDAGGDATVTSVSCGSPGNCAAFGYYAASTDKYGDPNEFRAFVVSETNGNWSAAHRVPTAASFQGRGSGGLGTVGSVSCAGAGYCVAGGSAPNHQAFIVVGRNGTWSTGTKVPGMATLTGTGQSGVNTVSCTSAGNCTAGGWYTRGAPFDQYAFVVTETKGKWGWAKRVKGIPPTGAGYPGGVWSLSCATAGNCAGGGSYSVSDSKTQAFVVAEHNGVWDAAIPVPGMAALNTGGFAWVNSVSCASRGNCAASGYYYANSENHLFVVAEKNGVWGAAGDVPGTDALYVHGGGFPDVVPVSCAPGGRCVIGGSYADGSGATQVSVTSP
jgi:hypothetical protein